jgi:hypothetical protein
MPQRYHTERQASIELLIAGNSAPDLLDSTEILDHSTEWRGLDPYPWLDPALRSTKRSLGVAWLDRNHALKRRRVSSSP